MEGKKVSCTRATGEERRLIRNRMQGGKTSPKLREMRREESGMARNFGAFRLKVPLDKLNAPLMQVAA
jgi:hypothetical protein